MTVTAAPRALPGLPDDFCQQIQAAVDLGPQLDAYISDLRPARYASIFLVGCGGSLFTFAPLRVILDRSPVPVFTYNSSELLLRRPALFGAGSLVIASSSNGATEETARAAEAARTAGATVLGVTQNTASIVAEQCSHVFAHRGVEAKQVLLTQLGWSLLKALDVGQEYGEVTAALQAAPQACCDSIASSDTLLAGIARDLRAEPVTYVLGAGPLKGAAQTLAMCYLQEMQNKHAVAVGAGEFLHGPFEVVTDEVPVLLLKGEDMTRPIAERAERFLAAHTGKLHVVDAAALPLDGVDRPMRPLIGNLVLGSTLLNRTAEHFESWTGRRLTDRNYMWKIDY